MIWTGDPYRPAVRPARLQPLLPAMPEKPVYRIDWRLWLVILLADALIVLGIDRALGVWRAMP